MTLLPHRIAFALLVQKNLIQCRNVHFVVYCWYIVAALVICNWLVVMSVMLTVWCAFDAAGRSWVKMKKYQRSMKESESRFQYKRSGNRTRNWRQRYAQQSAPCTGFNLPMTYTLFVLL